MLVFIATLKQVYQFFRILLFPLAGITRNEKGRRGLSLDNIRHIPPPKVLVPRLDLSFQEASRV